ncbi:hypothetical protein Tco_0815530 [Tanacetum coccineum]
MAINSHRGCRTIGESAHIKHQTKRKLERLDQEVAFYLNGYDPLALDDVFGFSDEWLHQCDALIKDLDLKFKFNLPLDVNLYFTIRITNTPSLIACEYYMRSEKVAFADSDVVWHRPETHGIGLTYTHSWPMFIEKSGIAVLARTLDRGGRHLGRHCVERWVVMKVMRCDEEGGGRQWGWRWCCRGRRQLMAGSGAGYLAKK